MSVCWLFVPLQRVCLTCDPPFTMAQVRRPVKLIAPFDSIQGKIGNPLATISQNGIIVCKRSAASNTNEGKPYLYMTCRSKWTMTKQTAAQIAWTQKFGAISNATRARLIDASHMNADRAAFAQQTEYKTLYSFVWNLVRDEME